MKFKVNSETCICCGACASLCKEVFKITDEGYAIAKEDEINDEEIKENAVCAMESCPTDAIKEDK